MSGSASDRKGSRKPMPPKPIVYMWQPTEYRVVAGDELKNWEKMLKDRVGVVVPRDTIEPDTGTCSFTYCDPDDNAADDSDLD